MHSAGATAISNAWTTALAELAALRDDARFLVRIANYTNQASVARRLGSALEAAKSAAAEIPIVGKPETGAVQLAGRIAESLNTSEPEGGSFRVRPVVLEPAAYGDLQPETLQKLKGSAVVVFVVPAEAPFWDETAEFIARELAANREKVLLAVSADAANAPLESSTAEELRAAAPANPALKGLSCYAQADVAEAIAGMISRAGLAALATQLRTGIQDACRQLPPMVNLFADLLSMSHGQYARQIDFVRRDLEALVALVRQAQEAVDTQSRKALNEVRAKLQTLSATMRQQAEAVVQNVPIPRDTLPNQDMRTRLGRNITGIARTTGYREFDARVQSLAMDLNSARSVLLSQMDQIRVEAQVHLEELTLNLGPELLAIWLRDSSVGGVEKPMDFSLEGDTAFPGRVTAAARQARQAISDAEFTSGWASRLESLFKAEMVTAATAGWTTAGLDQALTSAVTNTWTDATQLSCGMLIGRLQVIVQVVTSCLVSSRMGSLDLPRGDESRMQLSTVYRGFAAKLNEMQQQYQPRG